MPKQTPKKTTTKKRVQKTTKNEQVNKTSAKRAPKKTTKKVAKKAVKKTTKKRAPAKPKDIVIVSPVDPNSRMTVSSELADDEMIEQELMGAVLPYFIYQFEQGKGDKKQTISGLTVKGVNEVVRKLNMKKDSGMKIRINPDHMKIENNVEVDGQMGVQVSVYAENLVDGNSAWGIKWEAYKKTGRNGQYTNEFAVEKALSKAERNAKRKLIPETMAIKMIQTMIGDDPSVVKQLGAPPPQQRVGRAAEVRPSTKEEIQQIIRDAIMNSNEIDRILEFDRKTQADKRFDDPFKEEIRKLAAQRVDQLQAT
jgi:hypothetical protein